MLKRTIIRYISILFIMLANISVGQTFVWSMAEKSTLNYVKVIGENEGGFYVLRSNMPLNNIKRGGLFKKREYNLSCYDDNMKILWSKAIQPEEASQVATVLFVGQIPVVVYYKIEADAKQYAVYIKRMDEKGVLSEAIALAPIKFVDKDDIEQAAFLVSNNQSYFAILKRWVDKSDAQYYYVDGYSADLKTQWHKQIDIPISAKNYPVSNILLTNIGDVLLMGERGLKPEKDKNDFYTVMYYNHVKDSLLDIDIGFENRKLTGAAVAVDSHSGKAVVSGFYSEYTNYSTAGIFYTSIDLGVGQVTKSTLQAFSPQFLNRFVGERKVNNKELVNYYMDKLILRSDGGAVLTAENYYTTSSSYYDYFTRSYMTRTNYHYNNALAISVNSIGELDWAQIVNKAQISTDDNGFYSSYNALPYQSKICYVFNELNGKNNRVQAPYINNKGEFHNNTLFTESEEVLLVPKAAKQVDENTLIIPAEKAGKFCFLKITY